MKVGFLTTAIVAFSATLLMAQDQTSQDQTSQDQSKQNRQRYRNSQGDHDKSSLKSPEETKKILDQASINLSDAIRTAERTSQGKACLAQVATWECVRSQDQQDMHSNENSSKNQKLEPNHPIVRVVCLANGSLMETIICGKSGDVLDKRECRQDGSHQAFSGSYRGETWFRPASRWQKSSDLIGKSLTDSSTGEQIGEAKELVVDPESGRILYLAVEFSEKMGHGTRWYPIPISAVHLTDDYKSMGLKYSAAQISNSNGFDPKTSWPNMTDEKWAASVHKTYGEKPYWVKASDKGERGENSSIVRTGTNDSKSNRDTNRDSWRTAPTRWQKATDLMGKKVFNRQNEELGKMEEIVIDPDSGRIIYGVLSFGGFLGMGDKFFAIPWGAMELTPDYDHLVFDIEKDRLKSAEGFDKKNWPNMADQRWAGQVHDYYGRPRYWENQN